MLYFNFFLFYFTSEKCDSAIILDTRWSLTAPLANDKRDVIELHRSVPLHSHYREWTPTIRLQNEKKTLFNAFFIVASEPNGTFFLVGPAASNKNEK